MSLPNSLNLQVVGKALVSTLEEGLGNEFTADVKEAWTSFYHVVSNRMMEGLNEAYTVRQDEA